MRQAERAVREIDPGRVLEGSTVGPVVGSVLGAAGGVGALAADPGWWTASEVNLILVWMMMLGGLHGFLLSLPLSLPSVALLAVLLRRGAPGAVVWSTLPWIVTVVLVMSLQALGPSVVLTGGVVTAVVVGLSLRWVAHCFRVQRSVWG